MPGDILGGALIGGVTGGIVSGLYLLVMKLLGKPVGAKKNQPREASQQGAGQVVFAPTTWKIQLRPFLLGCVWFFVLWIVSRVVIGAVIGAAAGAHAASSHTQPLGNQGDYQSGYQEGYSTGQAAALQFFQHYGLLVMAAALLLAAAGTITGFLPGTRRATVVLPRADPASEDQWPPSPTRTS